MAGNETYLVPTSITLGRPSTDWYCGVRNTEKSTLRLRHLALEEGVISNTHCGRLQVRVRNLGAVSQILNEGELIGKMCVLPYKY